MLNQLKRSSKTLNMSRLIRLESGWKKLAISLIIANPTWSDHESEVYLLRMFLFRHKYCGSFRDPYIKTIGLNPCLEINV